MNHPVWSENLIERTIKEWQPYVDKSTGEILTRDDAIEILNNVTALFEFLYELDQKYKKTELLAPVWHV